MDTTNINPEKCLDTIPDAHKPAIDTDAVKEAHTGTGYHLYLNIIIDIVSV